MRSESEDYRHIRAAIAQIPGDLSNDAVGVHVASLDDIYAPEAHAAALDPNTPIVLGARGSGKSFWAGVLGRDETRAAAASAYPRLGLEKVTAQFGYTGIGGPDGISAEQIDAALPAEASIEDAKAFWWASVISAVERSAGESLAKPKDFFPQAQDWEQREALLNRHDQRLRDEGTTLLILYDALDTVARTWARRRLLTEALLEVVWALRAYRRLRPKLFIRPDQLDDDALRFVELPKMRTGAVRLTWSPTDLYGLFFARIALAPDPEAASAFERTLGREGLRSADRQTILTRRWSLARDPADQQRVMTRLAGRYMGKGSYGYKKGNTYRWPIAHLADAYQEVTPRSFLRMMTAAAAQGTPPDDRAITAEGIRHGLRAASKTRVDQLHQEFPWIKGVLAPLAGLLLPQPEQEVYSVWERTGTVRALKTDAQETGYMPPFPDIKAAGAAELFTALERIGVMFRRRDNRLDMPDLFRVAARLLKKGGVAPL
ncbi:hypothetical protein [Allochromatium palmeri]|uniref:Uncharacterized protein n=1 Tax=Allochromatium palmeri TaxID=231048 RepID=A0A6N8EEX2_9GAMM|nr:hypothetical protein [Allochromatium palmeri]MTW21087.1 hypothetical protein [Allochromatium palmeri]